MIKLKSIDMQTTVVSTLAIPVCEDADIHDDALASLIATAKNLKDFSGKDDEELMLYHLPAPKIERVLFLGLGKCEKINAEKLRTAAGKAVKTCIKRIFQSWSSPCRPMRTCL